MKPSRPDDDTIRSLAHDLRNAVFGVEMNVELLDECDPTGGSSSARMRERAVANVRQELQRIASIADSLTALAVNAAKPETPGAPADGRP